jgi:hypothetical protein
LMHTQALHNAHGPYGGRPSATMQQSLLFDKQWVWGRREEQWAQEKGSKPHFSP